MIFIGLVVGSFVGVAFGALVGALVGGAPGAVVGGLVSAVLSQNFKGTHMHQFQANISYILSHWRSFAY